MPRGKAKGKKASKSSDQAAAIDATPGPATETQEPVAKLVRKNKATGVVEPRKPGRPHPDYEYGYADAQGTFHQGDPETKKRKPGRPAGSKGVQSVKLGRKNGSGLDAIGDIVSKEVNQRLRHAQEAGIAAFTRALNIK
jgi:hypothetical protein